MLTRRAFLVGLGGVALGLVPGAAFADDRGARRMARDNRRCGRIGARAERDGVITPREQRRLDRYVCRRDPVLGWVTGRFYTAGE